ncbi:hypothetical protein D9M68_832500 [compost metagenome]
MKLFRVQVAKGKFFDLHADAPHTKTIGHWCKHFEALAGDLDLLFWLHMLQGREVMKAIG